MTTTKRLDGPPGAPRPRTARRVQQALRARVTGRIVRWIGAGGRRRAAQDAPADPAPPKPAGNVVALTWVQTFGRAARRMSAGDERAQATLRPLFCRPT